jgi:hypothetical protein
LTHTQALLSCMEAGVVVPRDNERGLLRELYVQCRRQREVLAAVLRRSWNRAQHVHR